MVRNGENAPDLYAHLLLAWAQRREARSGVPVVESLRRFRVRAGGDWTRGRPENGAEGFFQPLNEGVDLDAPVRAVSITPRFAGQNPKILRKRFPNEVRQAVLAEFNSPSGVVNADTGWRVGMSGADFHEHLKFSDADAVGGLAQLEAVAALPDLMRNAKLVESYQDKKNNPDIRKMHRFQAALQIGDTSYSVKLTVKEFEDGTLHIAQDNPIKLYHHRLEKEMPAGNSDTLRVPGVNQPSAGTSKYTLRQLLEDVKDSEGNIFFVADKSLHQSDPARLRQNNVTYPNNGREVGRVSPEIARTLRLDKPGSIVLDDKGLHHIEERHGKEIRGLGFANARDFVDRVLENVSAVYDVDGNGRKYDLVSRIMTPQGRVMIRLEFAQSGDYYSVATAGPMRPQYYDKKTPLWERAQSNQLQESPDAVSGQSGVLHQQQRADRQIIDTSDGGVNLRIADEDGSSPRGSITPVDEGYLIRLYDKADLSTMLHETGHFFLLEMEQDIRAGIADASTIKDLAAIRRWLGAQGDAPLTRAQHEAFARGFERYLREGKAPSRELESIFARFRQWLVHLYRKATSLDVELNDDVRAVFNRMLAAEQNGIEFSSVKPEQSAVVSARFKSKDEFFLQRDGKAPESTLFQPMNSGVDPDLKITALPVMEETGNTWEYTKGKGRRDIINTITGILKNDYTSKEYELTRPGAEHLINSALRRGLGGLPHIAAVRNIHNLFNISIPVEIHADRKNQQDVSKMHHFFAPMLYREKAAESIYAVHILVKEYDGERRVELAGVQKLYDLQLEKKMPIEILGARPYQTAGGRPSQQTSFQIPLRQLLEGVNDSEGVPYFPENSSF